MATSVAQNEFGGVQTWMYGEQIRVHEHVLGNEIKSQVWGVIGYGRNYTSRSTKRFLVERSRVVCGSLFDIGGNNYVHFY